MYIGQCDKVIQGGASIFSRKEEIVATRNFALRQLAFLLLTNERDKFANFLEPVKKLILESLRYTDQDGLSLVQPVFIVLRVLLIRFTPKRLTSFWANILYSMVSVWFDRSAAINVTFRCNLYRSRLSRILMKF